MLLSCFRRLLDQIGIPLLSSSAPQPSVSAALQGRARCSRSWGLFLAAGGGGSHIQAHLWLYVCAPMRELHGAAPPGALVYKLCSQLLQKHTAEVLRSTQAPQVPPACCSLRSVWQRVAPGTLSTSGSHRPLLGLTAFCRALCPQRHTSLCHPHSYTLHIKRLRSELPVYSDSVMRPLIK